MENRKNSTNFTLATLIINLVISTILIVGAIIFIVWSFYGDAIAKPSQAIPVSILAIVIGLFLSIFSIVKYAKTHPKLKNKQDTVISKVASSKTKMKFLKPIPKIFTKKHDEKLDFDNKEKFNKEFALKSYKLPARLNEFIDSDKQYHYKVDKRLNIIPIKFNDIEKRAYFYLMDSDVFNIPPHCIPFAEDESVGEVIYVLDYNLCGKQGEPRVLCIDITDIEYEDNAKTDDWGDEVIGSYIYNEEVIANTFSEFLSKLEETNF